MTISVITATYNSARTVGDTLASVARQTHPHIEHIIVDGLSTDDTLGVVSRFPHVTSVRSEKDKGIYDAMNKGIARASGDIIAILNSDDFYPGDSELARVAEVFESTGCAALYGDLLYVDAVDTDKVIRNWVSGKYKKGAFQFGWMPPHPAFFVKRELYERFGAFNLDLNSAADYELMLRFIHRYDVEPAYLPGVLVKMRVGGQSNKSLKNRLLARKEDRKAWIINNLRPSWYTFYLKPARKLIQFLPIFR
jgi:glycosyltransferase